MKAFIIFVTSLAFLSAFSIQLSSGFSDYQTLASNSTTTAPTSKVTADKWYNILTELFVWLVSTIVAIFSKEENLLDYDYSINQNVRFLVTTNLTSFNPTTSLSTFSNELQLSKTLKTVFLVHGWLDDATSRVRTIENRLLNDPQHKGTIQTVFVDWSVPASDEYNNTIYKLPSVGRAIAAFAKHQGLDVEEKVHCIGHSLGAHVCGFFGKYLQEDFGEKLVRISGLDPAGPGFLLNAPRYRLDKSDAQWVEAIHTDFYYGTIYPIGHQDFYPNGGDNQPGCKNSADLDQCDHERVVDLYEDSIGCFFSAKYCGENVVPDENTSCTDRFALMGYNNIGPNNPYENSPEGSYYLKTKDNKPFCIRG